MFPLEASLVLRHPSWKVSPQGSLCCPCSFAASPLVKPLPSVVWAVAEEGAAALRGLRHPQPSIMPSRRRLSVPAGGSSWGPPFLSQGATLAGELWEKPVPCPGHGTHTLPSCLPHPAQGPSFCLGSCLAGMGD